MARPNPMVAIATVSAILALGIIALLVVLVTRLSLDQHSLHGLAIASVTLQSLSTFLIIRLAAETQRQQSDSVVASSVWIGRQFPLPSILLSIIAAIVTLATLILTKVELASLDGLILGKQPWGVLLAVSILWFTSLFTQFSLYLIIYRRQKHSVNQESWNGQYPSSRAATEINDTNELNLIPIHHPFSHGQRDISSPPLTPQTVNGNTSLRSSLTLAVRPASSKTKLLPYQSAFFRNSTATTSTVSQLNSSRHSHDSGLDTWDTSSVTPTIRETVLRSSQSPNNTNILPPIPGSRSPSPANILQDFPLPPSTASTSMPASPVLGPQHNFSRPCLRQRSASAESLHLADRSSSIAEEHIHPLFRTYSPNPAPFATPGTNVTAAPGSFEGLRISERSLHKIRSEQNLPSSRSLHSPSSAGPSSPLARSSPLSFPNERIDDVDGQISRREEV